MEIISVVGARPNFMKIAPIIREIDKHNKSVDVSPLTSHVSPLTSHVSPLDVSRSPSHVSRLTSHVLVHTGQHYDYEMSRVFFEDLDLPEPDIYLGVGSGTHAEQTGKVMIEFEKVLLKEKPDLVIVVGDVNSTLAAALAAVKLHIPVAHVEAGLRSFDREMPEEINRVLTDAISDYLFTPSPDADENLIKEGIPKEKIYLVGDVMVDSLLYNKERAKKSKILAKLGLIENSPLTSHVSPVTSHLSPLTPYALLTLHRPSNVDFKDSLSEIVSALIEISKHIPVIFPAHPRTVKNLKKFNLIHFFKSVNLSKDKIEKINRGIYLLEPLGYLDFLNLEMHAKFVMTDSGGIQEETTVLNIPCLTLRNTTERPITLTQGTNTLVWNKKDKIIEEAMKILKNGGKKGNCPTLWDGKTAERIVEIIAK